MLIARSKSSNFQLNSISLHQVVTRRLSLRHPDTRYAPSTVYTDSGSTLHHLYCSTSLNVPALVWYANPADSKNFRLECTLNVATYRVVCMYVCICASQSWELTPWRLSGTCRLCDYEDLSDKSVSRMEWVTDSTPFHNEGWIEANKSTWVKNMRIYVKNFDEIREFMLKLNEIKKKVRSVYAKKKQIRSGLIMRSCHIKMCEDWNGSQIELCLRLKMRNRSEYDHLG